ncbi:MAG TPA: agglutinin biogenesis protein MshI [Burkholderiales bacterium]|nr:agglutinin biogenesis protein MshI [Burkholderiales bacterium]
MRDANDRVKVARCGTRALRDPKDAERVARELELDRYQCLTLLSPDEYQLLLVEAPNVPAPELKAAVRWRLKDMLDYHVDDATIDVLDIPPAEANGARAHPMYAVAARNDTIRKCIDRFESAHIPLTVIDIAETAQRNIAALFETSGRGLAFLYVGEAGAMLTVNFRTELYMARRIEVGAAQVAAEDEEAREEARGRLLLELQRSFDHFERQFPFAGVEKLMLGPERQDSGIAAYLGENLGMPVERASLESALATEPGALGEDGGWTLFHVLGASLRSESKAL